LPIDSLEEAYDSLYKKFSNLDKSYVLNACCIERRQHIQEAYDKCKDYLDNDFTKEIRLPGNFISRLWELQLCSILLFKKYNLIKPQYKKKKGSRPDFCILDTHNNKI